MHNKELHQYVAFRPVDGRKNGVDTIRPVDQGINEFPRTARRLAITSKGERINRQLSNMLMFGRKMAQTVDDPLAPLAQHGVAPVAMTPESQLKKHTDIRCPEQKRPSLLRPGGLRAEATTRQAK